MIMNMSIGNFHCSHFALTPHSLSPSYILFSLLCANESRISTAGRALPSHSLYTHPWNSYTCLTVHASIRNRSSGRNSRGLLLTRWAHRDAKRAGRWQSLAHHSIITIIYFIIIIIITIILFTISIITIINIIIIIIYYIIYII